MSNSINPSQSFNVTATSAKRLADTPENRAQLEQEAGKDGKASVLAKQGNDLLLLSGAYQTESKIARLSADDALSKGDAIAVNGAEAQVLHTDDGFKEMDLSHITVAVLDSGLEADHPAFKNSKILPGYDAKRKDSHVPDKHGHGTHVAGIIAGALPEEGVAGVAQGATLMPVKMSVTAINPALMQRLADSIRYAVDNGANVINLSSGIDLKAPVNGILHAGKQHLVDEALDYAEKKGVVVVVAAGNEGNKESTKDSLTYPASHPTVIAVSNLDDTDRKNGLKLNPSSGVGPAVDLAAPGTDIMSSVRKGEVESKSGTSMAAPYVSGVVAQIIARHPDWTPAQIREHLYKTASDLGESGVDSRFGHGAVDPFKAIFGS
jgi:subtilisin family serine protease